MATQAVKEEKDQKNRLEGDGRTQNNGSGSRQDDDGDGEVSHDQGETSRVGSVLHSPLVRVWVIPGLVALICGIAVAAAYWHFAGSGKSGDEPSSKSSGSGKSSGSSKKSDTSKGADSSEGSDASHLSNMGKESQSSKRSKSGKGSESGKGSDSSQKDSGQRQLEEVEVAWKAALKEVRQAQDSENAARHSEETTKAILDFFRRSLFSAGRPGDASLTAAFWSGGQGKDVTLRKAVDMTDARVAEAFADRPLAEAMVRETLAWAYLSLGDAPKGVIEYERAFALRDAIQGDNHAETAACRNQLAVAYRLANRFDDASRLFDRNPNSPAYAAALAIRGAMLLLEKKPAEAELKLRTCLAVQQKIQPGDWSTFDTMSNLGQALFDQRKYSDAEPFLLAGYEGLKQHQTSIPPPDKPRLTRALERLVKLYEAWGQPDKALKCRQQLETATVSKKA